MTDEYLETCLRRFTWRIQSNHVSPWEFAQVTGEIDAFDQWCSVWSRWADEHVARGDEAAAAGHATTAGAFYVRAALFQHWASFFFTHEPDQFRRALEGAEVALEKAAPFVDPPMEMVRIPFEGTQMRGYLRRPAGDGPVPLAILVPGADSTREELYDLGDHILQRGVAILAFDGPGQGLVSFDLKLRPDFEVAISAVIDHVAATRDDVDMDRIVVGGISYGGMFACRAAAFDDRVSAVFSMSSWYSCEGRWEGLDPLVKRGLLHYMGPDAADVQGRMTMEGAAERITVPLLQVYGGQDPASPPEHAHRLEREVRGPATTVVYDEGVHVCNNVWYRARPLVADWVADQVGERRP